MDDTGHDEEGMSGGETIDDEDEQFFCTRMAEHQGEGATVQESIDLANADLANLPGPETFLFEVFCLDLSRKIQEIR